MKNADFCFCFSFSLFFFIFGLNDVVGRYFDGDDSDKVEDRLFAGQSQYKSINTQIHTHSYAYTLSST